MTTTMTMMAAKLTRHVDGDSVGRRRIVAVAEIAAAVDVGHVLDDQFDGRL